MKFIERYLSGEDGRIVYNDIYRLGYKAFSEIYYNDVYSVLTETFERIAFNLNIIYKQLKDIGYVFKMNFSYSSEYPLLSPLPDTNQLFLKLGNAVKDFGEIPLSLELFYKIVGACNLTWDYDAEPRLLWKNSDALQIASIDDLLSEVNSDDWKEFAADSLEYNELIALELSADYLHKDNVSGGLPYALQIKKNKSIDSLFLNEPHETTFINYLRICMENCGFSGNGEFKRHESYVNFYRAVKPELKAI
jgi:hypothetical protein